MANDLSARQWKLDTPVVFGNPGALLWPANLYIKQIEWSGFVASANLVIKDRNGKTVWQANISATDVTLEPVRLGNIGWVNGLVLDTLSSGTVVVYTQ